MSPSADPATKELGPISEKVEEASARPERSDGRATRLETP
jgi:hypothetical protein